jgi:2-oxoisovalerate dehydrogenase E2 component (dihydrolipoyl transacylase)
MVCFMVPNYILYQNFPSSYVVYGVLCSCGRTSVFLTRVPLNHPASSLHHLTRPLLVYRSVSPRSSVSTFEPLCEVQSDKASVEITSPYDGTVAEILVQEGQVAKVGEDLCVIEVDEEASDPSDAPTLEHRDTSIINSPPPSQEQNRDTPNAHESRPQPPSDMHPVAVARRLHPLDPNAPLAPRPESESRRASSTWQSGASSSGDPATATAAKTRRLGAAVDVLALPAVRHFARESGVDVALLAPGSGKNGRVERVDVERYLAGGKSGSVGEQPAAAVSPSPSPLAEEDVVVELGRTRYGMWKAMEKARV